MAAVTESDLFHYDPVSPGVSVPDPLVAPSSAELVSDTFVMEKICALAGDLNWDEAVNYLDLTLLAREFGKRDCSTEETCAGDIDGDNDVDAKDLFILIKQYGNVN